MTEPVLKIPLTQHQREFVNLGFATLSEALSEENNPFPTVVADALTEKQWDNLHQLLQKTRDNTETSSLFLHVIFEAIRLNYAKIFLTRIIANYTNYTNLVLVIISVRNVEKIKARFTGCFSLRSKDAL